MSLQGKLGVPGLPGYPGRQGPKARLLLSYVDRACTYCCLILTLVSLPIQGGDGFTGSVGLPGEKGRKVWTLFFSLCLICASVWNLCCFMNIWFVWSGSGGSSRHCRTKGAECELTKFHKIWVSTGFGNKLHVCLYVPCTGGSWSKRCQRTDWKIRRKGSFKFNIGVMVSCSIKDCGQDWGNLLLL